MARLLGEARVSILPDGTRFKPETEATVKKAVAGMQAKVRISADEDELLAKLSAAEVAIHKVIDKEYDAKFGIEESKWNLQVAKLKSQLESLSNKSVNIDTAMDLAKFNEGVAKVIAESDGMTAVVQKNADKMADSQAKVGAAAQAAADKEVAAYTKAAAMSEAAQKSSMERIQKAREADVLNQQKGIADTQAMYSKLFDQLNKKDKVKVNVDGSVAEVEAISLRERLKATLSDIKAKIDVDRGTLRSAGGVIAGFIDGVAKSAGEGGIKAGDKMGSGFIAGLGKSALMQNPGITAAVIAGLAALPAAVGVVGVLGGIALGAGLMYGAEKMIKAQVKSTTAAMKTLQTAMGGAATSPATIANQKISIASTQNTISQLSNTKKLTAAQQGQLAIAKQRLGVQQQALAASQGKGQGTAAQQASMQSYQREIAMLNQEMSAYNKINNSIANLKQQFLDFARVATLPLIKPFSDAIDLLAGKLGPSGALTKSFSGLFKAVAPLVMPVVKMLLEIIQGILPGMTSMLKTAKGPLSDLFIGFGKIVGTRIGQWFRDAAPFIKDSGKYFLTLIDILGKVGSWLIKFGGATAKAFAGNQFKGFGKLLGDIGNDLTKILIPAFEGWTAVMAPVIKDILLIVTPMLNFLAAHPAIVKAIAAVAGAWFLIGKAVTIAALAMKFFGFESEVILAASPWVALAAAIIIAVILIIKYWKPISAFFTDIWKHIWSGFIGPLINFFTNTIPHAFGVTLNWLEKNWPLLIGIIGGPFAEIAGIVYKYHKQIFAVISSAWGHIENVITGIIKPIVSVIVGAWNEIYKITKPIWNAITLAIKIPALIVLGIVGEMVIGVRNLFNMVWPWLYKTTKDVWGHIENAITGVAKPILSVIVGAWNTIKRVTSSIWNWLDQTTSKIWGHVENMITGVAKPVASVVVGAWNTIKAITTVVWNWLYNATKDIWGHVENFITGILKPIQNNIKSAWNNIMGWTRDAWNWVYNHIVGPLAKAATWVGKTFVSNIVGAFKGLLGTVQSIWNGLKSIVAKPINFVIQSIWNPFAGFVNKGLSIFGIKSKLPMGNAIKLARGGGVPGYAPGSDTVPAMLSPGEYVLNPTAARAIGHRKLDAINAAARPGGGQHMVKDHIQQHAGGGLQGNQQILADAERYQGHKYVWGGASNPTTGWDCSSFVGYVLGHDFGRLLPGGTKWNPNVHGPVASQYNSTPGFNLVSHNTGDIQAGDLLVENSGGHVGFGVGPDKMFSAFGTNFGTLLTSASNMTNIYRNNGALASNGPLSLIGSILTAAAQVALNGVEGLLTAGLSKVPGTGPMHDLPIAAVKAVLGGAKNALNNNPANFTQAGGGSGIPGGNPPGGMTGSDYANAVEGYQYFKQNLFGGNKIAAAGAVASIDGESTWNPFSVGTGGRGLIGWTPPSTISDAAFQGGMKTQLPAILQFIRNNGDGGAIADMTRAGSVNAAAQIWDSKVERAGKNDVHAYGLNLAGGIMNQFHATGGLIRGYATGGKVTPLTAAEKAAKAAAAKASAAVAKKAAATDAKRVAKLELLPMAVLQAREASLKLKMGRDTRTGNFRDYYGSTLALNDVDSAIAHWISPTQRLHDKDAGLYRKYSSLASKDMKAGNQKAFFHDSIMAARYAADISKLDKKISGSSAASVSSFVPLNIPLNRDYMTGFGQFGQAFRLGGTLPEGVMGRGVKTGMSYMMGAGERVVPPNSTAANPGNDMAQTNQLLLSLLAELRTGNQINKATAQNTQAAAKGLGNAGHLIR